MSWRLRLLDLGLRLVEKPRLARATDPVALRASLERAARFWFRMPRGARAFDTRLGGLPAREAVWGHPPRDRVLLWLHGGAYIQGSPRTHQALGGALSRASGMRVILPAYRLAPEHPFPAQIDDAMAAWRGLLDAGYDPAALALGGDSAGGGLAFATLHALGTVGLPGPGAVVAFSPWADLTLTADSLRRNAARDALLPASRMAETVARVLAGADPRDPRASPRFGTYPAPPPVLIQASRAEILADDATHMAEVLRAAGGDVTLGLWDRTPHAWQLFQGLLPEADAAIAAAGTFLHRHLPAATGPAEGPG